MIYDREDIKYLTHLVDQSFFTVKHAVTKRTQTFHLSDRYLASRAGISSVFRD
tara:strand:- start:408 stop:566 length:159 start_codon:yes stop_codon:yes gene_type:complete